jgi:hypothetical protein
MKSDIRIDCTLGPANAVVRQMALIANLFFLTARYKRRISMKTRKIPKLIIATSSGLSTS